KRAAIEGPRNLRVDTGQQRAPALYGYALRSSSRTKKVEPGPIAPASRQQRVRAQHPLNQSCCLERLKNARPEPQPTVPLSLVVNAQHQKHAQGRFQELFRPL